MTASGDRRRSTLGWLIANPVRTIRPWRDEVIEQQGFDARHAYVETYWLPVLGPSTVSALRWFADWLDNRPAGARVDLIDLGALLGPAQVPVATPRSTAPSDASSTSAWHASAESTSKAGPFFRPSRSGFESAFH